MHLELDTLKQNRLMFAVKITAMKNIGGKKMKKTRLFVVWVITIALVLALVGCGVQKEEPTEEAAVTETEAVDDATTEDVEVADDNTAEEGLVFGVSLPQLDADGFAACNSAIMAFAAQNGIEVISLDASNDVEKQLSQIEDFITQEVDAIIFTPVDAGGSVKAVEKANEAGIPIVAMDRSTEGGELTGLVESDNVAHGAAGADLIAEAAKAAGIALEDVQILELLGAQASSAGIERHEGFSKRAEELGLAIVASLPTEWQNDKAYSATLDAFQANDGINAIFEASDIAMHGGVESALKQIEKLVPIGEEGHIIISSVDGGAQGLDAIRNGFIDGIASQSLIEMGRKAAEIAYTAAMGESVEDSVVRLSPTLATPETVDSDQLWANN